MTHRDGFPPCFQVGVFGKARMGWRCPPFFALELRSTSDSRNRGEGSPAAPQTDVNARKPPLADTRWRERRTGVPVTPSLAPG